jgi:hypothetical protein
MQHELINGATVSGVLPPTPPTVRASHDSSTVKPTMFGQSLNEGDHLIEIEMATFGTGPSGLWWSGGHKDRFHCRYLLGIPGAWRIIELWQATKL